MRTAQNYAVCASPDGGVAEVDTFTCGHCQRNVFVPVGQSPYTLGGGCRICNQLICSKCVDDGTCKPWEQQCLDLERKVERERIVSQIVGR